MRNEKRKSTKDYWRVLSRVKKNFHITHQNCQSKVVTNSSENSTIPRSHHSCIGQHIETQKILFSKVKYSRKVSDRPFDFRINLQELWSSGQS